MRDIVADLVRHSFGLFEQVTVEGTPTQTYFLATDNDRSLFLNGWAKAPTEELAGNYGLSNLGFLKGLFDSPIYRNDEATLRTKRKGEAIEVIEFRDASGKSTAHYRTMAHNLCPPVQRMERELAWDVIMEPQKPKIAEFSYMANLFKEIDGNFSVSTSKDNDLVFSMGGGAAATHSLSLTFAEGVTGKVTPPITFSTAHFLTLMKLADKHATTIRVYHKGVMNVDIETSQAVYRYFMRCKTI